jgi:lipopolysaccharide assembly outer membrane protein LptD (OstA)
MISRTRFLITAACLCHVLLAPALVTSQSPPQGPATHQGEPVLILAQHQESDGSVYKLDGQAEIHYRDLILWADHATYNDDTGEVTADGHVVLDGATNDEHIPPVMPPTTLIKKPVCFTTRLARSALNRNISPSR